MKTLSEEDAERLLEAAREVVARWDRGDLAEAVRELDSVLQEIGDEADDSVETAERAMQAGMEGGVQAYNEAMGAEVHEPEELDPMQQAERDERRDRQRAEKDLATLKAMGFSDWATGGGCDAYGKSLPCGGHILVTKGEDGGEKPDEDDETWMVGLYDADGQVVRNGVEKKRAKALAYIPELEAVAAFPVGTRVEFLLSWDIFPAGIVIKAGEQGIVHAVTDDDGFYVKMDTDYPTLAEWENSVFLDFDLCEVDETPSQFLSNYLKKIEPAPATSRPGDQAAVYAEETGVDYATALARCNMD